MWSARSACRGLDLTDEAAVTARHETDGAIYEHDMPSMTDPTAGLINRWGH